MRARERAMARKKLDNRLDILRNIDVLARPPRGWIKAIREALGMTTAQLAKRLGVSQPRIPVMEKAESLGSIKLDTLERAARALDCRLVYALVPRNSLESMTAERAHELARKQLRKISHSMALEDQRVDKADEEEHMERLVKKLMDQSGSALWEDE